MSKFPGALTQISERPERSAWSVAPWEISSRTLTHTHSQSEWPTPPVLLRPASRNENLLLVYKPRAEEAMAFQAAVARVSATQLAAEAGTG